MSFWYKAILLNDYSLVLAHRDSLDDHDLVNIMGHGGWGEGGWVEVGGGFFNEDMWTWNKISVKYIRILFGF